MSAKMPEPITADEIRFGMRRIDADQQYIEVEQAEAYAQAVRDEALEEAARLLESDGTEEFRLCSIERMAAAIRALKEQP